MPDELDTDCGTSVHHLDHHVFERYKNMRRNSTVARIFRRFYVPVSPSATSISSIAIIELYIRIRNTLAESLQGVGKAAELGLNLVTPASPEPWSVPAMYDTNDVADDSYSARKTSMLTACKCQDNRVEYLVDSQRGRRQASRRSSRLGSQVVLAGLICPLHGIADDPHQSPSPPWERVAAAGRCRRSRSHLPHNRHARWDLSERLIGACKKDYIASEPPLSPGYGWAEPGKGWNRCSSRSRTHQRRATPRPRVCPRHCSKGEAWPHRVCLEPDPPQTTAYTPPAEARRGRDSDRCTSTIDDASPEWRSRSWAQNKYRGVRCASQSRQTGQEAIGARVVRQAHQHRMVAPAVGKHPAVFKGGGCRLEEAQNMKHELGRARSYNRSLRESNGELAKQVNSLRKRVDVLASSACAEPVRHLKSDTTEGGLRYSKPQVHDDGDRITETDRMRDVKCNARGETGKHVGVSSGAASQKDTWRTAEHRDEWTGAAERSPRSGIAGSSCLASQSPAAQSHSRTSTQVGQLSTKRVSSRIREKSGKHAATQTDLRLAESEETSSWPSTKLMRSLHANSLRDQAAENLPTEGVPTCPDSGSAEQDRSSQLGSRDANGCSDYEATSGTGAPTKPSVERSSREEIPPCEGAELLGGSSGLPGVDVEMETRSIGSGQREVIATHPVGARSTAPPVVIQGKRVGASVTRTGLLSGNKAGNQFPTATVTERDGSTVKIGVALRTDTPGSRVTERRPFPVSCRPTARRGAADAGESVGSPSESNLRARSRASPSTEQGAVERPATIELQRGRAVYGDEEEEEAPISLNENRRVSGRDGGLTSASPRVDEREKDAGQVEHLQLELHRTRRSLGAFKIVSLLTRRHTDGGGRALGMNGLGTVVFFNRWRRLLPRPTYIAAEEPSRSIGGSSVEIPRSSQAHRCRPVDSTEVTASVRIPPTEEQPEDTTAVKVRRGCCARMPPLPPAPPKLDRVTDSPGGVDATKPFISQPPVEDADDVRKVQRHGIRDEQITDETRDWGRCAEEIEGVARAAEDQVVMRRKETAVWPTEQEEGQWLRPSKEEKDGRSRPTGMERVRLIGANEERERERSAEGGLSDEGKENEGTGIEGVDGQETSYRRDCAVLAGTAKIVFALVALEHRRISSRFYRWKRMFRRMHTGGG